MSLRDKNVLLRSVLKLPRTVLFLAAISLFVYFVKILCFDRFAGVFFGAYKAGLFVEGVCLSVFSGCVFYCLVNQYKREYDFHQIRCVIKKSIERIYGNCERVLSEMGLSDKVWSDIAESDIDSFVKSVNPSALVDGWIAMSNGEKKDLTWNNVFDDIAENAKKEIEYCVRFFPFLDSELIRLILDVDACKYVRIAPFEWNGSFSLGFQGRDLYEYYICCKRLREYISNI